VLVTNHVLSGALIGSVVRRPVPAFLLGVASHFALDAIPHWGKWRDTRQFLQVAVPDGLTGLAAMAAFTAAAPASRRAAVAAGMVGAALPDIDKPAQLWFGFSPWPAAVGRFHGRIQDEALDRYGREAFCAALFTASALLLLHSRGLPRVSARSAS
jgi:predicted membrane protein